MKQKSSGRKQPKHRHLPWLTIVGVGLLAAVGLYLAGRQPILNPKSDDAALVKHTAGNGGEVPKLTNALSVSAQKSGASVDIDEVSLVNGGYVVIHQSSNGQPGKIVVASGYIEAGVKQDLILNYKPKTGTYFAMLHSDNGDHKFNATTDLPLKNAQAQPIMVMFKAQ